MENFGLILAIFYTVKQTIIIVNGQVVKKQFSHLVTMRIANSKVKNKGRESIVPNQKQGVQQPAKYGGSYLPSCKTNFVIVLLAQTILFSHFINTTAYLLGR